MKKIISSTLFLLASVAQLLAHGPNCACGHDPYAITPPHGGMMEITDSHLYVEVVPQYSNINLFLYDLDMNPILPQNAELAGKLSFPRNRPKAKEISFQPKGDHYTAKVNIPRPVHRFTLELQVKHQNSNGNAKIIIENSALSERESIDINIGLYDE